MQTAPSSSLSVSPGRSSQVVEYVSIIRRFDFEICPCQVVVHEQKIFLSPLRMRELAHQLKDLLKPFQVSTPLGYPCDNLPWVRLSFFAGFFVSSSWNSGSFRTRCGSLKPVSTLPIARFPPLPKCHHILPPVLLFFPRACSRSS